MVPKCMNVANLYLIYHEYWLNKVINYKLILVEKNKLINKFE